MNGAELGRACSTCDEQDIYVEGFGGLKEGQPLERPSRRWRIE